MGLFGSLRDNVTEIGVLVITIVLISILLLQLRTTTGVCPSGFEFNTSTANLCFNSTNSSQAEVASNGNLGTTIDTAVTGIATPVDYVQIILLVLVFAAIIGILVFKFGRGKGNNDF